jgi:hypothetical protein
MATTTIQVGLTSYVSLGTGPMYISPLASGIEIVAASSQPAASVVGHGVAPGRWSKMQGNDGRAENPFYFALAEQVWAIAPTVPQSVIVTT